jgi:hypothetical protein
MSRIGQGAGRDGSVGARCPGGRATLRGVSAPLDPVPAAAAGNGAAGLRTDLLALLEAVRRGDTDPATALDRLGGLPFRDLGFARVDTHRELRQDAPEAVLAEGKTPEEVEAIAAALLDCGAWRPTPRRTSARGWPGWRATCRRRAAS